jgi:deazaflavin-dependent oxidoreductase (nitroreductase family)
MEAGIAVAGRDQARGSGAPDDRSPAGRGNHAGNTRSREPWGRRASDGRVDVDRRTQRPAARTPLAYFTDGDAVILTASNYGGQRHPGWLHNLLAHPECELRIGDRGGRFIAQELTGAERDRLFALAADLYLGYANYAERTDGIRTIRMMRLTPAD